MLEINGLIP